MSTPPIWDDIIIGAGSSGAVLASRLSEQESRQVLLIEAGPDFPQAEQVPAAIKDATSPVMSGFNWDLTANPRSSGLFQNILQSVGALVASPGDMLAATKAAMRSPQPLANTLQQFPYPAGKIVGGSSAINGALALRAFREDIEKWHALGNTEWSWERVLPYFLKIESDRDFPDDALHGKNGPIPVTRAQRQDWHELQTAFHTACREIGLPEIADLNLSSGTGVGPIPTNSIDGTRISTASAYLTAARSRPNLTIRADCTVGKLLFEGQRAIGIEVHDKEGNRQQIRGKRLVLSAGAINTVAILLRSGIGNSRLCRALGVSPIADLPGVGENLSDHPAVTLWMTPRSGICEAGKPVHQLMARAASKPGGRPDLNLFMLSNFATAKVPMLSDLLRTPLASGITLVSTNPVSRGRVFLESATPGSKPVIELNFGSVPEDIECLMQGMKLVWKIVRSQELASRTQSIFMWNESTMNNDNFLKSAVNRFMGTGWHAAGTAKMGLSSDPMAVVDQYCRVHGIENLRIVDASVMPLVPSTPTNLSCIMLAERVAEWMAQEAA